MNEWMNGLKCESNSLILYFFDEEIVRKWQNNNENKKSKFFFINRILIISNQTHTHNLSTIFLNDKNKFSICLTLFGGYFFFGTKCLTAILSVWFDVCVDMWFVHIRVVQMVKCKDRCCSLFFYIHTQANKRNRCLWCCYYFILFFGCPSSISSLIFFFTDIQKQKIRGFSSAVKIILFFLTKIITRIQPKNKTKQNNR